MDFFLPELRLAFELQGAGHYRTVLSDLGHRRGLDAEKRRLLEEKKIVLVEVPFWDNSEEALRQLIPAHLLASGNEPDKFA